MPEIGKNESKTGYFTGIDSSMSALREGQATMAGGEVLMGPATVHTENVTDPTYEWKQEMKKQGLDPQDKEQVAAFHGESQEESVVEAKATLEPSSPTSVPDLALELLALPDAHIIISPTVEPLQGWAFFKASTFIVNQEDWKAACFSLQERLAAMAQQTMILCPDLPKPYDDPTVGPLLALSGHFKPDSELKKDKSEDQSEEKGQDTKR
tara:strand:+ start:157 stop:786 length:630 start_codon:yes stop_codon:yes gene_type:complete